MQRKANNKHTYKKWWDKSWHDIITLEECRSLKISHKWCESEKIKIWVFEITINLEKDDYIWVEEGIVYLSARGSEERERDWSNFWLQRKRNTFRRKSDSAAYSFYQSHFGRWFTHMPFPHIHGHGDKISDALLLLLLLFSQFHRIKIYLRHIPIIFALYYIWLVKKWRESEFNKGS